MIKSPENPVEQTLNNIEESISFLAQVDLDPSTFPRLKSYLRERLAKVVERILKAFHQPENKLALKPIALKQTKEWPKQTTNLILIQDQKKTMLTLSTPSRQDLQLFHGINQKFMINELKPIPLDPLGSTRLEELLKLEKFIGFGKKEKFWLTSKLPLHSVNKLQHSRASLCVIII